MSDLSVGSTVAGCRLDAVAGRGGMGVVYRATQLALDRTVAVKAIAPRLAQDEAYRERFQRESHLAASLEHPNVIPVYEAGELDGTLYLIMRWVDGTDLRALLSAEGRLEPERALRLLRPVASALAAAHRRGLIHRDVKPANVLIALGDGGDEEHVYLTDFGIARRTDGQSLTRTGCSSGRSTTPPPSGSRAPREAQPPTSTRSAACCSRRSPATFRTSGRPRSRRCTPTSTSRCRRYSAEHPGLPRVIEQIVAKAMAKRPEDRYASAADLVSALDAALAAIEAGERPTTVATAPAPRTPAGTAAHPRTPASTGPANPRRHRSSTPRRPRSSLPPRRSRSRSPLLLASLALVAVAGVVVAIVLGGGAGKHGGAAPPARSQTHSTSGPTANLGMPVLHGAGLTRGNPIRFAGSATALAADGRHAWLISPGRLAKIGDGGAPQPISLPGDPTSVAVDPSGRVWMTGVGATGVSVFDPNTGQRTSAPGGTGPNLIAISADAAWLAKSGATSISRVPLAGGDAQVIPVADPISALGEAFGRVWVAPERGAVTVLNDDGTHNPPAGPVISPGTLGIASSNGVWFLSSSLTRVDPRAQAATGGVYAAHRDQAPVGSIPAAIGALDNDSSIWVLSKGDLTLRRIATSGADNNRVIATVTFPATPGELAVGDHILWVDVPSTNMIYPIRF